MKFTCILKLHYTCAKYIEWKIYNRLIDYQETIFLHFEQNYVLILLRFITLRWSFVGHSSKECLSFDLIHVRFQYESYNNCGKSNKSFAISFDIWNICFFYQHTTASFGLLTQVFQPFRFSRKFSNSIRP